MLLKQLDALIEKDALTISNLSNAAALLWEALPDVSWIGFYIAKGDMLHLGPFAGKPACIQIPFGKGVCGTCAANKSTQIVANVHTFPGHIACDSASNSEIVLPIVAEGRLVAVLDADSTQLDRFHAEDAELLEQVCRILVRKCDWNCLC